MTSFPDHTAARLDVGEAVASLLVEQELSGKMA